MTDTHESIAEQLLEQLETGGHDYHAQVAILIDALGIELHRLSSEDQRMMAADELVAMLRAAAGAPPSWPAPSRSAVAGAMAEAQGQGEGAIAGYCRQTRLPFTIAFDAEGEPLRFSVGRPRTDAEQAEAERLATRAVFKQTGLRRVDDDRIH